MLTHFSITQQGKSHIEKNVPCQDFSASKRISVERFGRELVLAAVSDGVGSREYSQFGSAVAVQSFMQCFEYNIQNKVSAFSDENILKLIQHAFHYALSQVEQEADRRVLPFLEFDSTLTAVVYDGHTLWFGHIGDDGVVVLYTDGTYEMITQRHTGEEAHSLFPLREESMWQFGKASKEVVSCVLMTDGVLDHCVDNQAMHNRVYFPFLEPALTEPAFTDQDAEKQRLDWDEFLSGNGNYPQNFRDMVTDDITFVVVQNPDLLKDMPPVPFDFDQWDQDTAKRKKELEESLYKDYRAYKAGTYQGRVQRVAGPAQAGAVSGKPSIAGDAVSPGPARAGDTAPQAGSAAQAADTETDIDALCVEAAVALRDVFKTAHNVGKFVRKQLVSKKRKTPSAQQRPAADQDAAFEVVVTVQDISDARPGSLQQDATADVAEQNGQAVNDVQPL